MATPYLGIAHIAAAQDQKEVTANDALDNLDIALNAQAPIAITDADYTVTAAQMASGMVLQFTGTITANRYINIPPNNRNFIVRNSATGGNLIVQVIGGAGASVAISPGSFAALYCDSVGVFAVGGGGASAGGGGGGGTGGTGSLVAYDTVPSPAIDGTTTAFTFPNTPNPPASLQFFKNGEKQMQAIDGTLSGAVWTYYTAPQVGDVHIAGSYTY